jgi:crotonobetainyl-CoA:carnitine CoA-transferase CaiB-like acyl-CoA transferase
MEHGPLTGIRVIDVTTAVAGPWATTQLAEQGADVIHIEKVAIRDVMRMTGAVVGDQSGAFVAMHRNKRSIDLDVRHPEGLEVAHRLVSEADVFVQNFRPGVADRIGLGYEVLAALNPELIYLSVSGFGADGPYSDQPVYDPIIQAMSGMAEAQNGDYVKAVVADKTAAMTGANAILAALVARSNGAGGQHVEVNLLDSMLSWMWLEVFWNESVPDATPTPTYSEWYSPYDTKDGQIAANWTNVKQLRAACTALGRPELADDPRFATRESRIRYADDQRAEFSAILAEMTRDDAIAALRAHDVACAPVLARHEIFDDPQVIHNKTIIDAEHPVAGRTRTVRPPARFSKTPSVIHRPSPSKGEHTDEVLVELGYSSEDLEALRVKGTIA